MAIDLDKLRKLIPSKAADSFGDLAKASRAVTRTVNSSGDPSYLRKFIIGDIKNPSAKRIESIMELLKIDMSEINNVINGSAINYLSSPSPAIYKHHANVSPEATEKLIALYDMLRRNIIDQEEFELHKKNIT